MNNKYVWLGFSPILARVFKRFHDMALRGMALHGMAWHGMARHRPNKPSPPSALLKTKAAIIPNIQYRVRTICKVWPTKCETPRYQFFLNMPWILAFSRGNLLTQTPLHSRPWANITARYSLYYLSPLSPNSMLNFYFLIFHLPPIDRSNIVHTNY